MLSDSSLTKVGGTASANVKVTGKLTQYVTDEAELGDFIADVRVENAASGGSRGANGSYVDYSEKSSTISAAQNSSSFNRASSKATEEDAKMAKDAAEFARLLLLTTAHKAKDAFQSGQCVQLEPTSDPAKRSGVKPKISFALLAAPRSKIDGTPTGGTVKADLTGDGSLNPAGTKVPADAKFTYVAPDAKPKKGSIAFEARSKRGVGKATLAFDTGGRGYKAVGGGGDWSGSGLICSLTEPFAISGQGLTNSFTPSSGTGGSYILSGAFQGKWQSSGSGSYTVDEQGGTLKANGTGRVTMMGRALPSYPHSVTFKLTPTDECP